MLIHPKHQEGATRQVKDSANDSKPGVKAQQQQQHAAVQDPEARAKLRRVVAGVLTGVTERFLSHPVETCKVVLQNTPASASAVQVISSRWRDKGLASFYRGIVPSTLGRGLQTSLRFHVTETVTQMTGPGTWGKYMGGLVAGVIDTFVMAPIESTKTRTQARGVPWLTTFRDTWRNDGFLGFYRGNTATLLRQTGNLGLRFGIFFHIESVLQSHFASTSDARPPTWIPLAAGATAGAISAYMTNPLDLIKTQVQAYSGADPNKRKLRVMEAIRKINAQDQGLWRKWFRGAWPRVAQQTPSVAVQFFLYRVYEQMLARVYPDAHHAASSSSS